MYTPQFRFALLISLFVIFGTLFQVLYTYSFGHNGLNINNYLHGVLKIASTTAGGFFFIWVCSKFITFNGLKSTGFEGVFKDEYGTNFIFKHPISLTKFLPEIIAKPNNDSLHPIEKEIIGFLACYKNMPFDLNDKNSISLHDYAIGVWQESKRIKGTNNFHHIVALSKHLGLVYAYKQKRKVYPLWQFWSQDKVSYSKRCLFHGGLSSFVLSTMPSFHNLDEKSKRTLLVAVRFADKPTSIPINCDPMAFNLYENVHLAEQRFRKKIFANQNTEIDPSETDILQFKQQIRDFLQISIKELNLNPLSPTNQSDGVYLGFGSAIIRIPCLLKSIVKNMSPDVRTAFDVWNINASYHKSWDYLIEVLKESNLLEQYLDDQEINQGINSFIINDSAITNSVLVKIENKTFPDLRRFLDSLPAFKSYALVEKSDEELIKEIKLKSEKINEFIQKLYN